MFILVRKLLMFAVVILCLMIVPSFGDAAIGTEPSNQSPEAANPALGPLPSVPSSPGFLPGMQNEGTTSYPPMNFSSPTEGGAPFYPQYVPPMAQGSGEMPGMMMSPYPSYPGGGNMYPPMYQDPSQYPSQPGYPSMPGMGYPGMDQGMGYPGMDQGMGYPGMDQGMGYPGMGYPGMGYSPYMPQYGSADERYNQARQAYTSRDYRTAMSLFQQVAMNYPQSDLADNAHYWIGEIYYAWRNYPAAIQSFQTVMHSYPRGNKVPDAMLKMGYAYAEMRQYGIARSILNDVAARFRNNTRIRDLAVKKLNELGNYY